MATNILSHTGVENAKPGEKPYLLNDGDRLNLRVAPNGTKTWLFIYNLRGKQKKHTLGQFSAISLARARELADECRANVAKGVHPLDAKRDKEAAAKAKELAAKMGDDPKTVTELFSKWDANYLVSRHSDKGAYVKDLFTKHVFSHIGDFLLPTVRSRHITHVLDEAATRRSRLIERHDLFCTFTPSPLREVILQYFVRTNQHDERFFRPLRPAIPNPSQAPQAQGAATQDHRCIRPRHPAPG